MRPPAQERQLALLQVYNHHPSGCKLGCAQHGFAQCLKNKVQNSDPAPWSCLVGISCYKILVFDLQTPGVHNCRFEILRSSDSVRTPAQKRPAPLCRTLSIKAKLEVKDVCFAYSLAECAESLRREEAYDRHVTLPIVSTTARCPISVHLFSLDWSLRAIRIVEQLCPLEPGSPRPHFPGVFCLEETFSLLAMGSVLRRLNILRSEVQGNFKTHVPTL